MGFTKHIRLPECANGKADEEKLGCCVGLAITPTPRVCSAVLLSPSTLCLEADALLKGPVRSVEVNARLRCH